MIIPYTDTQYQNEHGEVYPWFTKPCLEWLDTIDLSNKWIIEYGSGLSTLWFAKRCGQINSVECSKEWYNNLKNTLPYNAYVSFIECNEGDSSKAGVYTGSVLNQCPTLTTVNSFVSIVIVDGILRNECLKYGIQLLSKQGGIIIADNWQQREVWISEQAEEIMKPYKRELYVEPSRSHEVNPWTTAVFHIPKCL